MRKAKREARVRIGTTAAAMNPPRPNERIRNQSEEFTRKKITPTWAWMGAVGRRAFGVLGRERGAYLFERGRRDWKYFLGTWPSHAGKPTESIKVNWLQDLTVQYAQYLKGSLRKVQDLPIGRQVRKRGRDGLNGCVRRPTAM